MDKPIIDCNSPETAKKAAQQGKGLKNLQTDGIF
jgi:hypothetical protein